MTAKLISCVLLLVSVFAATTVQAEERTTRPLRGTVVDENDKPIADAQLFLSLRHGWGDDDWKVDGTSNDKGEFELLVPAEWLERGAFYHDRTLWVHAPGYAVANTSAHKQLDRGEATPLEVKLVAEQPIEFHVRSPEGKPLAGCRVQPHHWHTGHIPPETILERLVGTTNDRGVATIRGVTPQLIRRMDVISDTFGTQRFAFSAGQLASDSPNRLPMLAVGMLEGELECDDKSVVANVRVAAAIQHSHHEMAEGAGVTTTDDEGRFKIPNLAEGQYGLYVEVPKGAIVRPVLPAEFAIQPGETTTLHVPYAPTAIVRGKVVARGSDKPVSGAYVSIRHGSWRQGEDVLTDGKGQFEARVLPGQVRRQLIVIPRDFDSWVRVETQSEPVEVTLESSPHELPSLELSKAQYIEGTVVGLDDTPLANAFLTASSRSKRVGHGFSDQEGKFRLQVAEEIEITSYGISLETTQVLPAEVITESPLVLRLQDTNKLANITETKSPTPDDKRRPPHSSKEDSLLLIVAKNVLIFEGRSMGWADLATELQARTDANKGKLETVGYVRTYEAYKDKARNQEVSNWAKLLTETTGVKVEDRGGLILNRAGRGYDSLDIADPWPPGSDNPVSGRVVNAEGDPVIGAQVLLLLPSEPRFGFGNPSVDLRDGQFLRPEENIISLTDDQGEFRFDFPTTRATVVVAAPEGFAAVAASSNDKEIKLVPWARVTARIPQNKELGVQTINLYAYITPSKDHPTVTISTSMGRPSTPTSDHELLTVPPLQTIRTRRSLWKENANGNLTGNPFGHPFEFTTEPGMTNHLEFGPMEE